MRSLGGLVLLAGIGVALFVYLPAPVDSGSSLNQYQRIETSRAAPMPTRFTPVARVSAFSPPVALTMPARRGTRNYAKLETQQPAAPAPVAVAAPAPAPVASDPQPGWQAVVSVTPPAPVPAALPKTLAPTDPDARYKLVLDIQQQLKRVGCYWGRMDGSWGLATKDAMKDFTNRVNAALPLDEPDYVQLTLIQSHAERTCGACPAGQSLSASGRCVGAPITAQAKQQPNAQVASTQKEVLPWKATSAPGVPGGQPLFKPMPTTVVSSEPLPGRMAIGGPIPASVDAQSAPPVAPPGVVTAPNGMAAAPATAALDPNAAPKPVTAAPQRRSAGNNSYHRRREGPGSPRYNLMLSLGGVY
jgi:hypothetical protein